MCQGPEALVLGSGVTRQTSSESMWAQRLMITRSASGWCGAACLCQLLLPSISPTERLSQSPEMSLQTKIAMTMCWARHDHTLWPRHLDFVPCRFTKGRCHVRLPWLQCQMLPPAEAPILKEVRTTWQRSQHQALPAARRAAPRQPGRPSTPAMPGGQPASRTATPQQVTAGAAAPSAAAGAAAVSGAPSTPSEGQGPLLLFPDTSALMAMLAPRQGMALPTNFTLERLEVGGDALRVVGWRQQSFATVTGPCQGDC